MAYRIINWTKYQGRKDREHNPWVKLHKSLLQSKPFFALPENVRWQWPMLMLLADDNTGVIESSDPDETTDEWIAWQLRLDVFDPEPLLGKFIEVVTTGNHSGNHLGNLSGCLEREERREDLELEKSEKGDPESVASLASSLGFNPVHKDIAAWLGEDEGFWAKVCSACDRDGKVSVLIGTYDRLRQAQDPKIAKSKGLTPADNPAAVLLSELKQAGVKLPRGP